MSMQSYKSLARPKNWFLRLAAISIGIAILDANFALIAWTESLQEYANEEAWYVYTHAYEARDNLFWCAQALYVPMLIAFFIWVVRARRNLDCFCAPARGIRGSWFWFGMLFPVIDVVVSYLVLKELWYWSRTERDFRFLPLLRGCLALAAMANVMMLGAIWIDYSDPMGNYVNELHLIDIAGVICWLLHAIVSFVIIQCISAAQAASIKVLQARERAIYPEAAPI